MHVETNFYIIVLIKNEIVVAADVGFVVAVVVFVVVKCVT